MAVAVAMAAALAVPGGVAPAAAAPNNNNTKKLLNAVTVAGVMRHEHALQAIADANGGTRASGTPGYASRGLASEPTQFSGRSDHGPFIDIGIPA